MAQSGDYGRGYPQERDPRRGPPVTPPQWGAQPEPSYREERSAVSPQAYGQPAQPSFAPTQPQYAPQPQRTQQAQYAPQPQYAPPQAQYQPPPGPPPRQRPRHTGRKVIGGLAGIIFVIIVISVAKNSGHGTAGTPSAAPATQAQAAAPASPAASTGPAGTASELQALAAAQNYLSDGQGFSQQGLIGQLDSPDGDNFSVADATWAVDHSGANWDAQAVDSAKGYVSDGEGFSREGLIQQMTSADGSQFTQAQATYAANAVGL